LQFLNTFWTSFVIAVEHNHLLKRILKDTYTVRQLLNQPASQSDKTVSQPISQQVIQPASQLQLARCRFPVQAYTTDLN